MTTIEQILEWDSILRDKKSQKIIEIYTGLRQEEYIDNVYNPVLGKRAKAVPPLNKEKILSFFKFSLSYLSKIKEDSEFYKSEDSTLNESMKINKNYQEAMENIEKSTDLLTQKKELDIGYFLRIVQSVKKVAFEKGFEPGNREKIYEYKNEIYKKLFPTRKDADDYLNKIVKQQDELNEKLSKTKINIRISKIKDSDKSEKHSQNKKKLTKGEKLRLREALLDYKRKEHNRIYGAE